MRDTWRQQRRLLIEARARDEVRDSYVANGAAVAAARWSKKKGQTLSRSAGNRRRRGPEGGAARRQAKMNEGDRRRDV